jgi:hypothetical protein
MAGKLLRRFRQPEYTGENRCLPCTAVNAVVALLAAVGVGILSSISVSTAVGVGVALVFLALSGASIYLRGYLVPGTPELTKRYFPPWLLRAFGKEAEPPTQPPSGADEPQRTLDPERELMRAGALEECERGDDLCLTDEFRSAWHSEMSASGDEGRNTLFRLLDIDHSVVSFTEFDDGFRAQTEGEVVGIWESEAAYEADLAAAEVLSETYEGWESLSSEERSRLLTGLRIFLDICPECGGEPELGSETVESCCSTREVAAVSCTDCGSRLFESPV